MNHVVLLVICFFSIEVLFRSNYIDLIYSIIKLSKKASYTIFNKNISDHWKEKIIPTYSLQMMKSSILMLLNILLIIFIFIFADKFFDSFLKFTFTLKGIIESILFAFIYAYIRKSILK